MGPRKWLSVETHKSALWRHILQYKERPNDVRILTASYRSVFQFAIVEPRVRTRLRHVAAALFDENDLTRMPSMRTCKLKWVHFYNCLVVYMLYICWIFCSNFHSHYDRSARLKCSKKWHVCVEISGFRSKWLFRKGINAFVEGATGLPRQGRARHAPDKPLWQKRKYNALCIYFFKRNSKAIIEQSVLNISHVFLYNCMN